MNRFVTRKKAENNKNAEIEHVQKRPAAVINPGDQNVSKVLELEQTGRIEEISVMEKLQNAIRGNDAQFTFDVLSKNRPFDMAMNKTMTKVEFASSYSQSSSDFMLLSVDETVVDAFKQGQCLAIRGETTDEAVLCTDDTTYPIKIIESATTVLLLQRCLEAPDSPTFPNFDIETVDGKCYSTGELCSPIDFLNIARLKDMLREQELRWDWVEREEEEHLKGYRMRDLLDSVQMSVLELKTALTDLPVVKFSSGRYRYLSHKYRGEMLRLIVDLLDEDSIEDVKLEKITFDGLRSNLPRNVPSHVIEWFLKSRCEKNSDSCGTYTLPKNNLIRDMTVVILYSSQGMALNQFRDLLNKNLPYGMEVDEAALEGVADISDTPFGKIISYLSPEDLPDATRERMLYLFEYRKLWSMEQLRPYFKDLFKSKVAFDKYVVQNCDYSLSESNEMLYYGLK